MRKTNFLERLSDVSQEAFDFVKKSVKKGQTIRLFTEAEAEENDNIIYDMPNASYVSKHGMYDEYAVVGVTKPDKEVVILLEGKGESSGETREIPLSELGTYYQISDDNLCKLADELSKLIK